MSTWINEHFGTNRRAQQTIARFAVAISVVSSVLVTIGVWLAR